MECERVLQRKGLGEVGGGKCLAVGVLKSSRHGTLARQGQKAKWGRVHRGLKNHSWGHTVEMRRKVQAGIGMVSVGQRTTVALRREGKVRALRGCPVTQVKMVVAGVTRCWQG